MTTCEQCGADSVDAQGRCQTCGWQAPAADYDEDGSPSLGETRAADVPDVAEVYGGRAPQAAEPRFERTAQMPNYGQPPQPPSRVGPATPPLNGATGMTGMTGMTGTTRYCGACGARITGNEAFCGQCGTPIGATGVGFGSGMDQQQTRYQVGGAPGWQQGAGDDPTEMFVAPPMQPYQQRSGVPYQSGYPAGYRQADQQRPAESSRTVRIVFGILCLAGSIGSAVAAIVLALKTS